MNGIAQKINYCESVIKFILIFAALIKSEQWQTIKVH
jgi:hypothetical protein